MFMRIYYFKLVNIIFKNGFFVAAAAFLFYGQGTDAASVECGSSTCPCNFCDLFVTGKNIVNFLWWDVAFPLAILLLVVAAFFFLISGGNPNLHTRAKSIATAAIMGLLITFGSWLVIGTIINFFANSSVQPWPWNTPTCTTSADLCPVDLSQCVNVASTSDKSTACNTISCSQLGYTDKPFCTVDPDPNSNSVYCCP